MARQFADESMVQMIEAGDNANLQDSRLNVKFYLEAIQSEPKSAEAGRPVFDERVMIQIAVPGQVDCLRRPAWEADYQRFPKHWAMFKAGASEAETGTPLKAWPGITLGQIAELATRNVRTVEQLASMADIDTTKFMGSVALRQAARDFIEAAKGNAPLTAMRAELMERDAKIAAMEAQMAEFMAMHATKAAAKESAEPRKAKQ